MRERARAVLTAVAVLAGITAVVMLWQAGQADHERAVWEFGQTLRGAFPSDPPLSGTFWRVAAGVSAAVAALSAAVAWITAGEG